MNLAKLPLYPVVIAVFVLMYALYKLNLPEGWPRAAGAAVLVAAWIFVAIKAAKDYNRPAK